MDTVFKDGIVSMNGSICLFEDLYCRYKLDNHEYLVYVWQYMAERLNLYGNLAICHLEDDFLDGKFGDIKQIEYKEPLDRFIWLVNKDLIPSQFIKSVDFVNREVVLKL